MCYPSQMQRIPQVQLQPLFPANTTHLRVSQDSCQSLSMKRDQEQRMLQKSKILGNTNGCSSAKQIGCLLGCSLGYVFGFVSIPLLGVVSGLLTVCGGVFVPVNEEQTRNDLVNYLQNNEITD